MEPIQEPVDGVEESDDESQPKLVTTKKKSSKQIVIPVVEDDIDLDTVREYIQQMKGSNPYDKISSNKATNGSRLADFESQGIGERDQSEIVPVHSHEMKEKVQEEFKRRLEISQAKYKLSQANVSAGNDPEKGLLYATEASSILYEQFISSCKKLEEDKYKEILEQKINCMLLIAKIQYKHSNYKESIRELNSVCSLYILLYLIYNSSAIAIKRLQGNRTSGLLPTSEG